MQWNGTAKATHRDDNKTQCCTRNVAALRKDIVYIIQATGIVIQRWLEIFYYLNIKRILF